MNHFRALSPRKMLAACALLLIGVSAIDWFTGPDLQLLLLFVGPVLLAGWYVGHRAGLVFAALSPVAMLVVSLSTAGSPGVPVAVANAATRFCMLVLGLKLLESERRHVQELSLAAAVDPLTRALNRRAFDRAVTPRLVGAGAGTMLYLDVDGLKQINDHQGHEAGDEHLVTLSQIIRASIRDTDLFARLGGDEFAVFLTDQDVQTAHQVAARLVAICLNQPEPIRLSIGLAPAAHGILDRSPHPPGRRGDVRGQARRRRDPRRASGAESDARRLTAQRVDPRSLLACGWAPTR